MPGTSTRDARSASRTRTPHSSPHVPPAAARALPAARVRQMQVGDLYSGSWNYGSICNSSYPDVYGLVMPCVTRLSHRG